jgi:hypothetical protein
METNFIAQPTSQIVYNTLYYQKLIEKSDEHIAMSFDLPTAQYLSRIVNLNLKSFVDNKHQYYVSKNTPYNIRNLIYISYEVDTYDNCLISGFEVGIDNIENEFITFKIFPGLAILDSFLIELNEFITFKFDSSANLEANSIVIILDYDGNGIGEFSIGFYLIDENNQIVNSPNIKPWSDKFFPIGLFTITERDNDFRILALESLGVPLEIESYSIYNAPLYEANESLRYQFAEVEYIDLIKNKTVLGLKSLTPLYTAPKLYSINNSNFLIPNYGKHVNLGYEFARLLFIEKSTYMYAELGIPILKPTNNNLYNSMFTSNIFAHVNPHPSIM